MSDIRAVGYGLKDAEDDAAYQMLVTDVQRLKQEMRMGSMSGAGGVGVGGPGGDGPGAGSSGALLAINNLSDLTNVVTARANLGLGTAATASAATFLLKASNLSDVASVSTARTNLGLGSIATFATTNVNPSGNMLLNPASILELDGASVVMNPSGNITVGSGGVIAITCSGGTTINGPYTFNNGSSSLTSNADDMEFHLNSSPAAYCKVFGRFRVYTNAGTNGYSNFQYASADALTLTVYDGTNTASWIWRPATNSGTFFTPSVDVSTKAAFFGATAVGQQTVTGSRAGNAALASLLTKLALFGLIVDGSS